MLFASFLTFLLSFSYFFLCIFSSSTLQLPSFSDAERDDLRLLSFEDRYVKLFGDENLMLLKDGKSVHISLDQRTGAGFASQDLYLHGFFSGSIKLPSDYAAGVIVAFYMSNGDVFEKTHDELDFEFLGNIRGREWKVQTNVYGNGSTAVGREERFRLWFDPTEDFHRYSILWTHHIIIFSIDGVPIREIKRGRFNGGGFPSKPMSLYATIWDGSGWATSGGRYKVNYKYAPYVAEFTDLILHGCSMDPIQQSSTCDESDSRLYKNMTLSSDQRSSMVNIRREYLVYSYCYDQQRYPIPPPECEVEAQGTKRFVRSSNRIRFGSHGRSGKKNRSHAHSKSRFLL